MLTPKLQLSHYSHSGYYLPHRHTSYAGLLFVVMLAGVVLASVTFTTLAATPYTGPEAGSVGLSGTVPAPPPSLAAVITAPTNGQHFGSSPITVKGTCPVDTIVELYKNNIFAGSTPCQNDKTFSLNIDLLYGQNQLIARVYDALDQVGPDSAAVTVFYDALPAQSAPIDLNNTNGLQLLLRSSPVYRGTFPGQQLQIPLEIIGGAGPFAVSVDWGDNHNDLIPRDGNGVFNATHTYARAGTYEVIIKATDKQGRTAYLGVVAIINGKAEVATGQTTTSGPSKSILLVIWPLWLLLLGMVVAFWLGERREKYKLTHQLTLPGRGVAG